MGLTIIGPSTISIPAGDTLVQQDYFSTKPRTFWDVFVQNDGGLDPDQYEVTIDPATGLLTVELTPGTTIPPNTSLQLLVTASAGPGNGNNDTQVVTVNLPAGVVPCFVEGTLIETENGPCPVEDLNVGDNVRLASAKFLPIVWIGQRCLSTETLKANPHFRPICIRKGALGEGRPNRDLYVSPQHRIVLEGWQAELLFGESRVFVAANHLVNDDTIRRVSAFEPVTYYHIACQRHAILIAQGLETESLFPGDMALGSFDREDAQELKELFPELRLGDGKPLRQTRLPCLKRVEAAAALGRLS